MKRVAVTYLLLLLIPTCLFGVVPLRTSTRFHDEVLVVKDSVHLWPLDGDASRIVIEARGALKAIRDRFANGSHWWGIVWGNYPHDYYQVALKRVNSDLGDYANREFLRMDISRCRGRERVEPLNSISLFTDVNPRNGAENSLQIILSPMYGRTAIYAGSKELVEVASEQYDFSLDPVNWGVVACGSLNVVTAVTEVGYSLTDDYRTEWTAASLDRHFARSNDPIEGYWQYLDRDNDDDLARIGGRYRLAVVADGSGGYDIIYMSGAEINADDWHEGMRRGHLKPTSFVDHYDLKWVDAAFEMMDRDIHASIEQGAILTLSFPLYRTKVRYSKER